MFPSWGSLFPPIFLTCHKKLAIGHPPTTTDQRSPSVRFFGGGGHGSQGVEEVLDFDLARDHLGRWDREADGWAFHGDANMSFEGWL